jgi:uncharacterized protein (TIGR00730 family)
MSGASEFRRLAVFCGSSMGNEPRITAAARDLATLLARAGLGIVYGGATRGLMGLIADQALAAGGEVIGLLPRSLQDRELAHQRLTRLHIVETMHERKALKSDPADGCIALAGGFGALANSAKRSPGRSWPPCQTLWPPECRRLLRRLPRSEGTR